MISVDICCSRGCQRPRGSSCTKQSRPVHAAKQWQCRLLVERILWEKRDWSSLKDTGNDRMIFILQALEKQCQKTKGTSDEETRFFTNKRAVDGWCG